MNSNRELYLQISTLWIIHKIINNGNADNSVSIELAWFFLLICEEFHRHCDKNVPNHYLYLS